MALPLATRPLRQRERLLRRYFFEMGTAHRLSALDGDHDDMPALVSGSVARLIELRQLYTSGLQPVTVARSPISGDLLRLRIDTVGLDGPWWDYECPARPAGEPPGDFIGLTGGIRIEVRPAPAPFFCRPGPEVPYVIPELMSRDGVIAVISQLSIGANPAFAVSYFGPAQVQPRGWIGWGDPVVRPDFDLEPWIAAGGLRWVAPGDPDWTLQTTQAGCPYLQLPGRHQFLTIKNGKVWS